MTDPRIEAAIAEIERRQVDAKANEIGDFKWHGSRRGGLMEAVEIFHHYLSAPHPVFAEFRELVALCQHPLSIVPTEVMERLNVIIAKYEGKP